MKHTKESLEKMKIELNLKRYEIVRMEDDYWKAWEEYMTEQLWRKGK